MVGGAITLRSTRGKQSKIVNTKQTSSKQERFNKAVNQKHQSQTARHADFIPVRYCS